MMINQLKRALMRLERLPGGDARLPLRLVLAYIFYSSGRTKVGESFWVPTEFTIDLFADEYALPIIDPVLAAQLAVYAETFLPAMLVLGLGTRVAAGGLLFMTLVIQFLVYPGMWIQHLGWAIGFAALVMQGAGPVSMDCLVRCRLLKGD